MKASVLYHPNSEHARAVETFARDISRIYDRKLELVSLSTREGAQMAELYDIVQYPAILVTANNGSLIKAWQGPILPLMDEVVAYSPDRLQSASM